MIGLGYELARCESVLARLAYSAIRKSLRLGYAQLRSGQSRVTRLKRELLPPRELPALYVRRFIPIGWRTSGVEHTKRQLVGQSLVDTYEHNRAPGLRGAYAEGRAIGSHREDTFTAAANPVLCPKDSNDRCGGCACLCVSGNAVASS